MVHCSVIFIHMITGSSQLSMFCRLAAFWVCVHYSSSHFKLYYGSCSIPYIRRLELDLNPSTPMLEVTRWHQTCICKNTFALHRLCQFMFAFWWLASDHGRKSLTNITDSACPSFCPVKRARCVQMLISGTLNVKSYISLTEQNKIQLIQTDSK